MNVFTLMAEVAVDTGRFGRDMQQVESRADRTAASFTRMGGNLQMAGRTMTQAGGALTTLTAPILGLGVAALAMGGQFESSMNRVGAITGATGEAFDGLADLAKELGRTTQFSASQSADAMQFLAMAGFTVDEIMTALPGTLNLAAAGQLDLATAADIASNVLTGMGLEAAEIGRVNDVMALTANRANTNIQQLGDAFKFVGPVAASVGMSIEETAAFIGKLSDAGLQGEMAGTALRGAITRLLNPSDSAKSLLRDLGVTVTDTSGNFVGMTSILEQFGDSSVNTAQLMEIFGQRAGPGMAALLGIGAESVRGLTNDLENSAGTAAEVAERQMEGLQGSLKLLQSAFEGLAIAIAESGLLEFAAALVDRVASIISRVAEANPMLLRIGAIIGGLVATVGPVLIILGQLTAAIGTITTVVAPVIGILTGGAGLSGVLGALAAATGPIGLVIAAVGALVAIFATDFLGIRTFVTELATAIWDGLSSLAARMVEAGRDIVAGLLRGIRGMFDSVRDTITELGEGIAGRFRRLLGIESPSRVFQEYGRNIGEGLTLGIQESAAMAERAAADLARGVVAHGALTRDALVDSLAPDLPTDPRDRVRALSEARERASAALLGLDPRASDFLRNILEERLEAITEALREASRALQMQAVNQGRLTDRIDTSSRRFLLSSNALERTARGATFASIRRQGVTVGT